MARTPLDFTELAKQPEFYAEVVVAQARFGRSIALVKLSTAVFILATLTMLGVVLVLWSTDQGAVDKAWALLQTLLGGAVGFWVGQKEESDR